MPSEMVRGDKYVGALQVGQEVYCGLYGGKFGIITRVSGEQKPETIKRGILFGAGSSGGAAYFDVAFPDHLSRMIPECIIRGVQWEISGEVTPEAVPLAIQTAEAAEREKKEHERKQAEQRNADRKALPGRFPYLETMNSKVSSHALGAKNIRAELKRAFQGIKFSVTSKCFSGGDSIDIHWTDGPTTAEVKKITDKYQEGSFDGMEDIYNYDSNNVWPGVFGGAKYVMESRSTSPALVLRVARGMGYTVESGETDRNGCIPGLDWEETRRLYREVSEISDMPEVPPTAETPEAITGADGITITENTEKGGIEIRFPSKPAQEVLDALKAEGWRWSRFGGFWYHRNTLENMEFAKSL